MSGMISGLLAHPASARTGGLDHSEVIARQLPDPIGAYGYDAELISTPEARQTYVAWLVKP